MPDDVAIRMQGVGKGFGSAASRTIALRGVDLEVRTGEMLMLSGPSGCGKTTLISIMAGILDADVGTCQAFGCDINAMSESWRADFRRHRVGFVFQSFNLLPCLSVIENVCVPLQLIGLGRREAREIAAETLERVGLSAQSAASPGVLSGGQQQRVAIARALVHRPMLLICDEPTSALDHENGRRVIELLRELAVADGRSVVVVTHDPRILPYADRIAHMDDGCIRDIHDCHDERADPLSRPLAPGSADDEAADSHAHDQDQVEGDEGMVVILDADDHDSDLTLSARHR